MLSAGGDSLHNPPGHQLRAGAFAVAALGGALEDIARTRIFLKDITDAEAVSRAHGRIFGDLKPVNTLLAIDDLAGDYLVEIEAEAIVTDSAEI